MIFLLAKNESKLQFQWRQKLTAENNFFTLSTFETKSYLDRSAPIIFIWCLSKVWSAQEPWVIIFARHTAHFENFLAQLNLITEFVLSLGLDRIPTIVLGAYKDLAPSHRTGKLSPTIPPLQLGSSRVLEYRSQYSGKPFNLLYLSREEHHLIQNTQAID